jgi:hypothetical protein
MSWFNLDELWSLVGGTWGDIGNLIQDPGGEIFVRMSGTGRFAGHASNVINYSYSEGSTPLVPGDESGAIGDVSIEVLNRNDASILLYKDEFYLQDRFHGSVIGNIENVSGSSDTVNMGGRSILSYLNIDKILPPRRDTIGNVLEAIINDVGLAGNIIQDVALPPETIDTPGYEGDVWVFVKQLCSAYEVEMTVVRDYVVIRPTRTRTIDATNIIDKSWQIQDITLAQEFDVAYYNYEQQEDYLVHPEGGWTPEVQVYSVGSGETITFEIPIEFYLTSITQPIVQDTVAKDYAGPASFYAVSGNDNLPIPASQWTSFGGDMSFAIKGDGTVIEVTLTGMDFPSLAPFSIGISDGSSSYSTLRICGSGMDFNREIYTEKTGLTSSDTPIVNGGEIDNPAIDTLEDAKRYALFARRLYSLPTQTFSTSSRTFPRLTGSLPTIFYPTFDDYNDTLNPSYSFSNFNDEYAGLSFDQWTQALGNTVPQGFGEVSGAKVKLDDAMYRVRSVTITPDIVSFDAEYDTLFSDLTAIYRAPEWQDVAAAWGGMAEIWDDVVVLDELQKTFNDFNSVFAGTTFKDFALIPLRQELR